MEVTAGVAYQDHGALRRLSDAAYVQQAGPAGRALADAHSVRQYESLRDLSRRPALNIRTVLYIGANEGQEAELLLRAYPDAHLHCLEPQPGCLPALASLARRWPGRLSVHPIALSDSEGEAELRRPESHDQASSLLAPNDEMQRRFPQVQGWSTLTVSTLSLDAWAASERLVDDVVIKMDVQGAESLVIAGGETTFRQARLVVCGLAVVPTYSSASDMHTMFKIFERFGYSYAGELGQVRDTNNAVVEFDGAFVRLAAR